MAKTTIYRSWPSKAAVVMDAVLVESDPQLSFPDTGSAREDLRLQISRVATLFTEPAFGKPFVGLLAASQHDPVLADALHQWLITARRAGAAEVLRRGIERGELRADLDVEVAIDALYGAIYYRLLVSHQPLSAEYARSVVDEIIVGLQAPRCASGHETPVEPAAPRSAGIATRAAALGNSVSWGHQCYREPASPP